MNEDTRFSRVFLPALHSAYKSLLECMLRSCAIAAATQNRVTGSIINQEAADLLRELKGLRRTDGDC
jgi:hypothetical protein